MDILFIQELKIPKKMTMTINVMPISPAEDDGEIVADISEGKWWHDEEIAL